MFSIAQNSTGGPIYTFLKTIILAPKSTNLNPSWLYSYGVLKSVVFYEAKTPKYIF